MCIFKTGFMILFLSLGANGFDTSEDVIWRSFNGSIPHDALLAGNDHRGPVYIGQVPYKEKLIPGKLYQNDKHIYFEFGEQARKKGRDVKILCTEYPQNFEWLPTQKYELERIRHHQLVVGGYEPGFKSYIGKVVENGNVDVGKVICGDLWCLALYTWHNGKYVEYHTYDILIHTSHPSVIHDK